MLNSAEAIGEHKGVISIGAETDNSSEMVKITIDDTGPGIPETCLSKIFDPFFTTKETSSGTGLGLSIVYGIIKQHSGMISAENKNRRSQICDSFASFYPAYRRLISHDPGH